MYKREVTKFIRVLDIPEDKINEYKEAFDMFDRDKQGTISCDEIYKIMKNQGNPMKKEEIEYMIEEIDEDGDGEINFEEFVTMMEKQTNIIDETEEEAVLQAFRNFDRDHDGKITNFEFKYILGQIGDGRFSNEEINLLFKEADLDADGMLDYQDFIRFWRQF